MNKLTLSESVINNSLSHTPSMCKSMPKKIDTVIYNTTYIESNFVSKKKLRKIHQENESKQAIPSFLCVYGVFFGKHWMIHLWANWHSDTLHISQINWQSVSSCSKFRPPLIKSGANYYRFNRDGVKYSLKETFRKLNQAICFPVENC